MASISFRCFYCYRVHRSDPQAIGQPVDCLCGQRLAVPDVRADLGAPADQLPLAEAWDASAGESVSEPVEAEPAEAEPADEISSEPEPRLWEPETGRESFERDFEEWASLDEPPDDALPQEPDADLLPPPAAHLTGASPASGAKERAGTEREGAPRRATAPRIQRKGTTLMGKILTVLGILVTAVWLIHTSPWIYLGFEGDLLTKPLPEALGLVPHTHYFTLERAFWSAILAGLALGLLGEGCARRRRAYREIEEDVL
ncbi:MAG: hypothetical protein JXA90_10045 [Planctomycetes bacterium]|nr:hypothetical protein [Planctomycetota bacterium]